MKLAEELTRKAEIKMGFALHVTGKAGCSAERKSVTPASHSEPWTQSKAFLSVDAISIAWEEESVIISVAWPLPVETFSHYLSDLRKCTSLRFATFSVGPKM